MATFRIVTLLCICGVLLTIRACELPSGLRGSWISSHRGLLLFNGEYIKGYSVDIKNNLEFVDFKCIQNNGSRYLFRADQTARIYSHEIVLYTCLDIKQDGDYFSYYVATKNERFWNDTIFGHSNYTVIQMHEACNIDSYTPDMKLTLRPNVSNPAVLNTCQCPGAFQGYHIWQLLNSNAQSLWKDSGNTQNCNSSQYIIYTTNSSCNDNKCSIETSLPCLYTHRKNNLTYLYTYINTKTHSVDHAEILCMQISEFKKEILVFENFCSDLMMNNDILLNISYHETGKCPRVQDDYSPPKEVSHKTVRPDNQETRKKKGEDVPSWAIVILTLLILSLVALLALMVLYKLRKNLKVCFKTVHEAPQQFSEVNRNENNEGIVAENNINHSENSI